MNDSPSWLNVSEIDLERFIGPGCRVLEKEIETEYVKNHKNKALKLLNSMNSSELCGDEARFSYCEKGRYFCLDDFTSF